MKEQSARPDGGSVNARIGFLIADEFDAWLAGLGVSISSFADEMVGSWVFNYARAVNVAGGSAVIFAPTAHVDSVQRHVHRASGAVIVLLPRSRFGYLGLLSAIRREQCDAMVIQSYDSIRADIFATVAARLGERIFGTFTGYVSKLAPPWRRFVLSRMCGLIVCSQSEIDRLRRRYGSRPRIAKVEYAVDSDTWVAHDRNDMRAQLGIAPAANVLVYHGELRHYKGIAMLLDVLARVRASEDHSDCVLLLVGNGPDAPHYRAITRDNPNIVWLNRWIHDPRLLAGYLSAADVYVFASANEAYGISILEAMSCQLPVVAVRSRGTDDILPEGEASGGIVVPPADPGMFAKAVLSLLEDSERRTRIGNAGRRRVTMRYTFESVGRQLVAFVMDQAADDL